MAKKTLNNFAFIDVETTGLDAEVHEIIEIGLVIADNDFNVVSEFEVKIKPEHIETADPVALRVNKYNEDDWEGAVTRTEALQVLSAKAVDCIMVGHNVSFDSLFLEKAFRRLNIPNKMFYYKLDTLSIAFAVGANDPDIEHLSLHSLCEHFCIENKNAHTALSDARATFELFKKLMKAK